MSGISKRPSSKILQPSRNPKISVKAHAAFAKVTETRGALNEFLSKNRKMLEDYRQHMKDYDEAVVAAQQAYINEIDVIGDSYEGFSVRKRRSLNVGKLLQLYPDAGMVVRTEYKMSLTEFETAIRDNVIPEAMYDEVVEVTQSIDAPKGV